MEGDFEESQETGSWKVGLYAVVRAREEKFSLVSCSNVRISL